MPFIEDAQRVTTRAHASNVPLPARAGIVALSLLVLVLVAGNVMTALSQPSLTIMKNNESSSASPSSSSQQQQESSSLVRAQPAAQPSTIFVYVSGAVANPGVYELVQGSRVVNAVEAAGGFAEDAAPDAVNLARVVSDGEQVAIPAWGQEALVQAPTQEGNAGVVQGEQALVNINTASESDLQELPGIGPATASKIVQNRTDEGPFASPEDLMRVSGIGEKKFASIAELICV